MRIIESLAAGPVPVVVVQQLSMTHGVFLKMGERMSEGEAGAGPAASLGKVRTAGFAILAAMPAQQHPEIVFFHLGVI